MADDPGVHASTTAAAPSCVVSGLSAEAPVVYEPRVAALRLLFRVAGHVSFDYPFEDQSTDVHISWSELKKAAVDDVVRWLPAGTRARIETGETPGVAEVAERMTGPADGSHLGYAAVQPVSVTFRATCADGGRTSGDLVGWTDPQIGVAKCGQQVEPEWLADALKRYC